MKNGSLYLWGWLVYPSLRYAQGCSFTSRALWVIALACWLHGCCPGLRWRRSSFALCFSFPRAVTQSFLPWGKPAAPRLPGLPRCFLCLPLQTRRFFCWRMSPSPSCLPQAHRRFLPRHRAHLPPLFQRSPPPACAPQAKKRAVSFVLPAHGLVHSWLLRFASAKACLSRRIPPHCCLFSQAKKFQLGPCFCFALPSMPHWQLAKKKNRSALQPVLQALRFCSSF